MNKLKTLIGKLTPSCRLATERAANICIGRSHYEVDLEHLFLALTEQPASDFVILSRRFKVSLSELERDLEQELSTFKAGNTRTPVFSTHLLSLFEHAWLLASIDGHSSAIRSGHLLLALLTAPELAQLASRGSKLFSRFALDELKHHLPKLTVGSEENSAAPDTSEEAAIPTGTAGDEKKDAKTKALNQFTINLTQRAREHHIDPVIGREAEIRQLIDILLRRRQNNPILTGEAGVGKTAVVEGLAQKIATGDVPPPLKNVELHVLDLGLLQAGASVKGEFENRLKNVIDEVKQSPHPIILFIDEAHTMIGAGGQAGQNDAANLLKPALARGELRTIAATTWSEYKKYFEKDAALARRFQVVKVEEPSLEVACSMLRGMHAVLEKHFSVAVLDEAIVDAVKLSARYISGRQLPDKAVSVLDTACARVALAHSATPEAIEFAEKELDRLCVEIRSLKKENATGGLHAVRVAELRARETALREEVATKKDAWTQEHALVLQISALRKEIEADHLQDTAAIEAGQPAADASQLDKRATRLAELATLNKALQAIQGENRLVPVCVDGHVVAEVISAWTGIPLGKMLKDEIKTVLSLGTLLKERVIGQDHAVEVVAQHVRTARANLEDPNKPKGVFLFVGPSGVGKTETALALADVLYGGERNLITINMSEYQEAHTVSSLKGSPPGYIGYGEGGVLTEAVRRKPYSVVLLDEVEKAHPDVLELFFQVFDKGVLDDSEGREVNFRNTIIILTSNVASGTIMTACLNKEDGEIPDAEELSQAIRPQLFKAFKPAFLGRIKVVPYYPIPDHVLTRIIELKLRRIATRIELNHKAAFIHDNNLVKAILERCTEVDSGARNVDSILNGTVLPEIAENVLTFMAEGRAIQKIKITANKNGKFSYRIS